MSISPKISTVRALNNAICTGAMGWSGFMPSLFSFSVSSSLGGVILVIRVSLRGESVQSSHTDMGVYGLLNKLKRRGQRIPDAGMKHQIGKIVLVGGRAVQNDETRTDQDDFADLVL